ncbi:MAG: Xaa-Pro peptidase family protein [Thermocladium sp.]|jgi:Xaa-Pro aminopeptidase|nr:MAG: hypothetical protein AT710_01285 [Thermocladium sp. ECH_B]
MQCFDSGEYRSRIGMLENALDSAGIDMAVITPGSNMIYFTGFPEPAMERPIMLAVGAGDPVLIVPKLYEEQVRGLPVPVRSYGDGEDPFQLLKSIKPSPRKIAIDDYAYAKDAAAMARTYGSYPSLLGPIASRLRRVKTAKEIEMIKRAVQLSEDALSSFITKVGPGMTEHDAARLLKDELEARGLGLAFEPIVSSGPNSAMPHLTHTERRLSPGDSLVVDFGGRLCGYNADITRTFFIESVSSEGERIYDTVLRAQLSAESIAGIRVEVGDVDAAARKVIAEAGFGAFFIHRTGHGLGIDVHEEPYIVAGGDQRLEEGNVFTVEPGIYMPGKLGVRIEDDVAIMNGRANPLNGFPKELTIIGKR